MEKVEEESGNESRAGLEIERVSVKNCGDTYTRICAECGGHKQKSEASYAGCHGSAFGFWKVQVKGLADCHKTVLLWPLVLSKAEP